MYRSYGNKPLRQLWDILTSGGMLAKFLWAIRVSLCTKLYSGFWSPGILAHIFLIFNSARPITAPFSRLNTPETLEELFCHCFVNYLLLIHDFTKKSNNMATLQTLTQHEQLLFKGAETHCFSQYVLYIFATF